MAAISIVFTIARVAEMLGEDEEWLREISINMDPEEGRLWVIGIGEDGRMQSAAAQPASLGPGDIGKIPVKGQQQVVESGIGHQVPIQRMRPLQLKTSRPRWPNPDAMSAAPAAAATNTRHVA